MERGPIGEFQIANTGDEPVRAFVPHPLPPNPPLQMDGTLNQALAEAMLALGRLDGISSLLPDAWSILCACQTLVKLDDSFSGEYTQQHRSVPLRRFSRNGHTRTVGRRQGIHKPTQDSTICVELVSCCIESKRCKRVYIS